jgi:hypothetical protein
MDTPSGGVVMNFLTGSRRPRCARPASSGSAVSSQHCGAAPPPCANKITQTFDQQRTMMADRGRRRTIMIIHRVAEPAAARPCPALLRALARPLISLQCGPLSGLIGRWLLEIVWCHRHRKHFLILKPQSSAIDLHLAGGVCGFEGNNPFGN